MGNARRAVLGLLALAPALALMLLLPEDRSPEDAPKAAGGPADSPHALHPAKATGPWLAPSLARPISNDARPAQDEADPEHPDYDPVVARNRLDISMQEVVEREPRDDAWADARETLILELLAPGLDTVPGFPSVQGIECRSHSCRVQVSIDDGEVDRVLGQYPVMMLSPTSGGRRPDSCSLPVLGAGRRPVPPGVGLASPVLGPRRAWASIDARGPP